MQGKEFGIVGEASAMTRFGHAVSQFRNAFWGDQNFTDRGFLIAFIGPLPGSGDWSKGYAATLHAVVDDPVRTRDIEEITKALAVAAGVRMVPCHEIARVEPVADSIQERRVTLAVMVKQLGRLNIVSDRVRDALLDEIAEGKHDR